MVAVILLILLIWTYLQELNLHLIISLKRKSIHCYLSSVTQKSAYPNPLIELQQLLKHLMKTEEQEVEDHGQGQI